MIFNKCSREYDDAGAVIPGGCLQFQMGARVINAHRP